MRGEMCWCSLLVQWRVFALLIDISADLAGTVIGPSRPGYRPLLIDFGFLGPGQCDETESG